MGRKAKFDPGQVEAIRGSSKTYKELAKEFDASVLTILKVKNFQGAYKQEVFDLSEAPGYWRDMYGRPISGEKDV